MRKELFTLLTQQHIAKDTFEAKLKGNTEGSATPGQFVNILLDGFYLRRPISICDVDGDTLTLVYKTVGEGTTYLSTLKEGAQLDLLTGLGNGFDLSFGTQPLIIGGGLGIPPLYGLAKALLCMGKTPIAILGFQDKEAAFYMDKFLDLGVFTLVTTLDGSIGIKGVVTDALSGMEYDYYYTCGPKGMLKAVYGTLKTQGQFSFEEYMACGFGACMGCSCKTKDGYKRICKEGPILKKEEIVWGDDIGTV